MTDVFISYSRRDAEFGRKLHAALIGQQRDVWMDWEDIPLTAEWWHEITQGIEQADNFVLLISPDSIGSPICHLEIAHARQYNKRIIPILHRDPEKDAAFVNVMNRARSDEYVRLLLGQQNALELAGQNWEVLAGLNWIFWKTDDDFGTRFHQLQEALDTNLAHVKQHTRLLVRALEWKEHDRDGSYLLRGVDAMGAVTWLKSHQDQQPLPIALQQAFILACLDQLRQDEVIQQQYRAVQYIERRTWPAFFIGVLVGTVYFFFAYPAPDSTYQTIHRLGFSLGAGAVFGVILGALALYTDELSEVRFKDQLVLRLLTTGFYGLLFGSVGFGLLQAIFFDEQLDYISILGSGMGVALLFLLRSIFRLQGLSAFLVFTILLYGIIIAFSTTPDSIWLEPRKAIFYFVDSNQRWFLTLFMASGMSLSVTGSEIVQNLMGGHRT